MRPAADVAETAARPVKRPNVLSVATLYVRFGSEKLMCLYGLLKSQRISNFIRSRSFQFLDSDVCAQTSPGTRQRVPSERAGRKRSRIRERGGIQDTDFARSSAAGWDRSSSPAPPLDRWEGFGSAATDPAARRTAPQGHTASRARPRT